MRALSRAAEAGEWLPLGTALETRACAHDRARRSYAPRNLTIAGATVGVAVLAFRVQPAKQGNPTCDSALWQRASIIV
jgi:hypothetical protein